MLLYKDIYLFETSCSEFACFNENLKIRAKILFLKFQRKAVISSKTCKNCSITLPSPLKKYNPEFICKIIIRTLVKINIWASFFNLKHEFTFLIFMFFLYLFLGRYEGEVILKIYGLLIYI